MIRINHLTKTNMKTILAIIGVISIFPYLVYLFPMLDQSPEMYLYAVIEAVKAILGLLTLIKI